MPFMEQLLVLVRAISRLGVAGDLDSGALWRGFAVPRLMRID